MRLQIFRVDAFTERVFHGNPAAIVPLKEWLDDAVLQNIAMENNLSETAFIVPARAGYRLRWFTPVVEVPLCGHATLATAFVIFQFLQPSRKLIRFHTLSGDLQVRRQRDLLTMDFPRYEPEPVDPPRALLDGLRIPPAGVYATKGDKNYYAIYNEAKDVRTLAPDMAVLARLHPYDVAVSAPGDDADFVSRFFAPSVGIPEDPVTGSMHCALIPYWAGRLGKPILHARQVSNRGGELFCEDRPSEGRVRISGRAALSLSGFLYM
jgi:PhzF family phenazine biosynthesis protein